MDHPAPDIVAAIHALRGESGPEVMRAVHGDPQLALVLATAPDVHPAVHTVAALVSESTALLDPCAITDPTVGNAVRLLAESPKGCAAALAAWAKVAPAGWGADIADSLVAAVHRGTCHPAAAAVLIGPCAPILDHISDPHAAAFVIRRWGQSSPGAPAWWAAHVAKDAWKHLRDLLSGDSLAFASCVPWLPPPMRKRRRIPESAIDAALDAFTDASPHVRVQHASLIDQMVAQAQSLHLDRLTRLACATGDAHIWERVTAIVAQEPDAAASVIRAAAWNDAPQTVQETILRHATRSPVCAAIAAARGKRSWAPIPHDIVDVFFGALDAGVWDALGATTKRQLLHDLFEYRLHLAVRSLGPRPAILAKAQWYHALVRAVQQHVTDHAAIRWTLLPVALRRVAPSVAHALIAAMSTLPPDPGAFFGIACGRDDADAIDRQRTVLRSPGDLAVAVAIQRCAASDAGAPTRNADLITALRGRTWHDLQPIRAILDPHAHALVAPDVDALARRLSEPDHLDRMRTALTRLASLPPDIAIPSLFILHQWVSGHASGWDVADTLLNRLRDHGDISMDLVDALPAKRAHVVFPLPTDPRLADAVRALARDHVDCAHHLALALEVESWDKATQTLLTAPPWHANAVWNALPPTMQRSIERTVAAATSADKPHADVAAATAKTHDPITALALAALRTHDESLRSAGIAALSNRPSLLRMIWSQGDPALRTTLLGIPELHLLIADLSHETRMPSAAARATRLRMRT